MRSEARHDMIKVWVYFLATVVLGAALTPVAYNLGQALAEVTYQKQTNGVVEIVAGWCRAGGIPWYFRGTWTFAALVLAVPLLVWIKVGPGRVSKRAPWGVRLPGGGRSVNAGQELAWSRGGYADGLRGAGMTLAVVLVLGAALIQAGAFGWRGFSLAAGGSMLRLLPWALAFAVLQEIAFRGFALGVFLRVLRPFAAVMMAGLLYALVGCLVPADHLVVPDAESGMAGFGVVAAQLQRLSDPWVSVSLLLPAWAFGCVLGFARWRTRSLWMPVGLHAGWLLGNGVFLALAVPLNQPDPFARVLVGASLQDGLIPLVAVTLAGITLHFLTPEPEFEPEYESE